MVEFWEEFEFIAEFPAWLKAIPKNIKGKKPQSSITIVTINLVWPEMKLARIMKISQKGKKIKINSRLRVL